MTWQRLLLLRYKSAICQLFSEVNCFVSIKDLLWDEAYEVTEFFFKLLCSLFELGASPCLRTL